MKSIPAWRLSPAERDGLATDGYVVREAVFTPAEVDDMLGACERLIDDLARDRRGHRMKAGSYVFDPDFKRDVIIKWEGDTDVVHGVEPFAHLSPALERWAHDPRFLVLMCDFVGADAPILFTEKLNLKRPQLGGVNPLHQDYPYWVGVAQDPTRVATSMLFLDDANLHNACLRVVPASHTSGVWKTRTDEDQFATNEIDDNAYEEVESVPLEVPAGSVVMFGPYLVHHSHPNTFCARTHMSDPGDGSELSATNWTRIDYAGNGQWSREEDIYSPANFGELLTNWQNAKAAASAGR